MPQLARIILISAVIVVALAAMTIHVGSRYRHHRPKAVRLSGFKGHTADLNKALKGRPAPWQPEPDTGAIAYQRNQRSAGTYHPPTYADVFSEVDEPRQHRRVRS